MKMFKRCSLVVLIVFFGVILYACSKKDTKNEVSMRVNDGYIQWQLKGDKDWKNLISIDDLKGTTGEDGLGIQNITINEKGELVITYTDGTDKNLGDITGNTGEDGLGIQNVEINDKGDLIITFTDGTTMNLGGVTGIDGKDGKDGEDGVGIQTITINDAGELIITLTDGTVKNLGVVIGSDGEDGVIIVGVEINEIGHLIIRLSDGETLDVGPVVGSDGREIELRNHEGYIQWRYVGDEDWKNLISLDELMGETGKSAYEIYLEYYPEYEGTEEEWLDDLINGRLGKKETVTVTFELNGGQLPDGFEPTITVNKLDPIVLPVPHRENYRFVGWYIGEELNAGQFLPIFPIIMDLTLYARWLPIPVSGFEILTDDLTLTTKDTVQVEYRVYPEDALNRTVKWISNNPNVASVDENGVITAHNLGVTTIMGFTEEGGYADIVNVTVNAIGVSTVEELEAALLDPNVTRIKLLADLETDVLIEREITIDFNGHEIVGNIRIDSEGELIIEFTGSGVLTGDLIIHAPYLYLKSDLTVLGMTIIESVRTFETTGSHQEGIHILGASEVDTTDNPNDVDVNIQTDEPVFLIGTFNSVEIQHETENLTIDGEVDEIVAHEDATIYVSGRSVIRGVTRYNHAEVTFITESGAVIPDIISPQLVGVLPLDGTLLILKQGESFVLVVQADDENLYKLEVDHSLEHIIPEFSVYADPLNPYGSEEAREQFEAYGVNVVYDEETKTWTIDFGLTVTDIFLEAETVKFYFVIHDMSGNTWGTMYGTTPENTFTYSFMTEERFVLETIVASNDYLTMKENILRYANVLTIDEEILRLFDLLPADQGRQQAIIGGMLFVKAHFETLDDVKAAFEFLVDKEYKKWIFIQAVDNAQTVDEMLAALLENVPELNRIRQLLISEGMTELLELNDTTALYDLNQYIEDDDQQTLRIIARKLLNLRLEEEHQRFWGTVAITDALRAVLDSDLTPPVLEEVKPNPDNRVIVKDCFVWIIRGRDENLYKLEVDHSLEDILPEFSVYADADNPYGSDEARALFEAYGVTVAYDEETQTWTIEFGENIVSTFVDEETVTFYIVLYDLEGNMWGSMYELSPENTFTYTFIHYSAHAFEQILESQTTGELYDRLQLYRDALNISDETFEYFDRLTADKQESILNAMMSSFNIFKNLDDISDLFTLLVNIAVEEDTTAPELVEITPVPGTTVYELPFVVTIQARDVNLYRLMLGPDFSVYANEENPYGSPDMREILEAMGVTVLYDSNTQTWTIIFGEEIVEPMLEYMEDEFIIQASIMVVLEDASGNRWGDFDSEDNRYIYWLDLTEYIVLKAIREAETIEDMEAAILDYAAAIGIDEEALEMYDELPIHEIDQATIIEKLFVIRNGFNSLEEVREAFEMLVNKEYVKIEFIAAINWAPNKVEMVEMFGVFVYFLHDFRQSLIALGFEELADTNYTTTFSDLYQLLKDDDIDGLLDIAEQLIQVRSEQEDEQFTDIITITDALRTIIDGIQQPVFL